MSRVVTEKATKMSNPLKNKELPPMCVREYYVFVTKGPKFVKQVVPCRKCWACIKNKQNDLIGRMMCEIPYHEQATFLTLTYGDKNIKKLGADPLRTSRIYISDFQEFLKRWRHSVGNTKYLVAGEYGSKKGRTHFHAILLHPTPLAEIPLFERFWRKEWPWGHLWAEPVHLKNIRYVTKYITKQITDLEKHSASVYNEEWHSYSKQPILGAKFILERAWEDAANKVFPRDFNYVPPGYTGKPKLKFSFYGQAQNLYFDTLFALWPEALKTDQPLQNDLRRTEWMQNALLRYRKYCLRREFELMTKEERSQAYADGLRITHAPLDPLHARRMEIEQGWQGEPGKMIEHALDVRKYVEQLLRDQQSSK